MIAIDAASAARVNAFERVKIRVERPARVDAPADSSL